MIKIRPDFNAGHRNVVAVFDRNCPQWFRRNDSRATGGLPTDSTLVHVPSIIATLCRHSNGKGKASV